MLENVGGHSSYPKPKYHFLYEAKLGSMIQNVHLYKHFATWSASQMSASYCKTSYMQGFSHLKEVWDQFIEQWTWWVRKGID